MSIGIAQRLQLTLEFHMYQFKNNLMVIRFWYRLGLVDRSLPISMVMPKTQVN